ncbi:MAG TPA: hypothetical protein EYQ50_29825 [Verrucomicrobiales bacterium]|nr:hypothetical protein [Verrucomicrobiales bacterium]
MIGNTLVLLLLDSQLAPELSPLVVSTRVFFASSIIPNRLVSHMLRKSLIIGVVTILDACQQEGGIGVPLAMVLDSSPFKNNATSTGANPLTLGMTTSNGRQWRGKVAEVLLYNTDLDPVSGEAIRNELLTKWLPEPPLPSMFTRISEQDGQGTMEWQAGGTQQWSAAPPARTLLMPTMQAHSTA